MITTAFRHLPALGLLLPALIGAALWLRAQLARAARQLPDRNEVMVLTERPLR